MAPRARFMDALDQILSVPYDREKWLSVWNLKFSVSAWNLIRSVPPNYDQLCGKPGHCTADGQWPLPPDRSCVR